MPDVASQELMEFVGRAQGQAAGTVHKLNGDASSRSYYRVETQERSYVVMAMPVGARAPEEVTSGAAPAELPFVNVQRYLDRVGVRVPHIVRYEEERGLMLLEDLGDLTLAAALATRSREELYGQAVDLLARLRARTTREPDSSCVAFTRAFDRDLYRWELDHFYIWGLVVRSGRQPSTPERQVLDSAFEHLSAALDTLPRGFTHRDYQSRNLMIRGGELVVLDFQDALLGPTQYDLVALLRDSYVELERPFVEKMVARYCAALEGYGIDPGDLNEFLRVFDLVTLQRKLKDGGRFVFIDRVKKNPSFLPSAPPSFRYVKEALASLTGFDDFREVLARYVPEIA